MDAEADQQQTRAGAGTEWPTAFDETTPADRAGWEEALAGQDNLSGPDLRPEAEGKTDPEQARGQGRSG